MWDIPCAFDALASILLTAASDDPQYEKFMEQAENEVFSFILKLKDTGVSPEIYKERFILLKSQYENTKLLTSLNDSTPVFLYDTYDNASDLWNKFFEFHPSTFHTLTCEICQGDEEYKTIIQINHSIILNHGYQALQQALEFQSCIEKKKCYCGWFAKETAVGNNHIYIELGSRRSYEDPPQCARLQDFPRELVLDTRYR